MIHRYSRFLPSFTLISDIILLNVAYFLAHQDALFVENIRLMMIKTTCWLLLSPLFQIYKTPRPLLMRRNMFGILEVLCYHLLLVFALIYFTNQTSLINYELFLTYIIFIVLVACHRYLLASFLSYIRKKGYNSRKIAVIGDHDVSRRLQAHFRSMPSYGYEILPDIDTSESNITPYEKLAERLKAQGAHEVFLCYKIIIPELLFFLIPFCNQHNVKIKLVSDLILTHGKTRLINYDSLPVWHLDNEKKFVTLEQVAKRSFDVLFSSTLMILGSPVFVTLYLITKLSSKGPAYYTQERIGLHGKPFQIIKFRSMYTDAENLGPQLSKHGDPRITKWGKIIRKTRLDELPQFYNVLKGEMSIVGPRPERLHFIEKISEKSPHYTLLQKIKPGITSIGQINYGYAENVDQMCERMEYDLLYLHNVSLQSDIQLILHTVRVMLQGKGK